MNEEEIKAMNECKILMICLYDYMSIEKSRFYCNQYKIILNLIDKQQEEIKARLEEIDSLYKMMSAKDDKIEQMKEDYQILKDDIEGHRIAYIDTPEFEEKYISKDKIEAKIEEIETMPMLDFAEKEKFDFKYSLDGLYCMQKGVVFILKGLLGE